MLHSVGLEVPFYVIKPAAVKGLSKGPITPVNQMLTHTPACCATTGNRRLAFNFLQSNAYLWPMPIHSSRGPFQNRGVYPSCSSHLATTINALLTWIQLYGFDSMVLSTHDSCPMSQFLRLRVKLPSVRPLTIGPMGLYVEVFSFIRSEVSRYHVSWWSLRASIIFLSEFIVKTPFFFPLGYDLATWSLIPLILAGCE